MESCITTVCKWYLGATHKKGIDMNRKIQSIAIAAMLATFSAYSAVLVSDDFETGQVGQQPTSASVVRPSGNEATLFTTVVDSSVNTAGTGNGVQLYDFNPGSGLGLTYNFVSDTSSQMSAVRADVKFSCLDSSGAGDKCIYVAFGDFNAELSLNAKARRFTDARLYNDGTIDFRSSTGASNTGTDISTGSHSLSIFVNDYDTDSVNYVGVNSNVYVLGANSVAYWLDGALIATFDMDLDDIPVGGGTVGTTTNNLGKFGFNSGSGEINLSYAVDDIVVSSLEEVAAPEYLMNETYEFGQTVGEQPTGAANVRPTPNNATAFVKIVDTENTAGTGNGVQIFDNASVDSSADITALEYNFVGGALQQVSALRVDFSFAALGTNGPGDRFISVGLGEYNTDRTFQTTANRYIDARLYNNGTIDFRTSLGTNAPSIEGIALLPGANTLSIFANDYDSQSVQYTGLDSDTYTLPTNSVAYWLNGSLVLMDDSSQYTVMDLNDATAGGTVGTTENNLGKFGFTSGTAEVNLNYVVDNIYITTNILASIDGYAEWLDLYPGLGSTTNYLDDFEPDGMNNLLEYALGGNPTLNDAAAVLPTYSFAVDGGTSWMNYVYNRRDNAGALGLTYDVFSDTDLVIGSMSTPTEELGFAAGDPGFEVVTNRVPTDVENKTFMQLKIEAAQ